MNLNNREQVFDAHARRIMKTWYLPGFKITFRRLSIVIYKAMGCWARIQNDHLVKQLEDYEAKRRIAVMLIEQVEGVSNDLHRRMVHLDMQHAVATHALREIDEYCLNNIANVEHGHHFQKLHEVIKSTMLVIK